MMTAKRSGRLGVVSDNASITDLTSYHNAYTAGIHFVHYYRFVLAMAQRKNGFSPPIVLVIRLTIASALTFPESTVPFFDVRQRPALVIQQPEAAAFNGMWVVYVLLRFPEAVIRVFFTSRAALAKDGGHFSRTAHFQV